MKIPKQLGKKKDSKQYESDHFFFKKVFNKKSLTQDPSN